MAPPDGSPRSFGLFASGVQAYRIESKLDAVLEKLGLVLTDESLVLKMEKEMSKEVDDLNAAIADLTTVVTSTEADIAAQAQAILDANANDDGPGVEAGVAQITALTAGLRAALAPVTTAAAAVPPAPAPDPALVAG